MSAKSPGTSAGGGGGLDTTAGDARYVKQDGTTTGAASQAQALTLGLTTGANGPIGIGKAPAAMLDVLGNAALSAPVVMLAGTKPAGTATFGSPAILVQSTGFDGGDTSSSTANRFAGSGSGIALVLGNGGAITGTGNSTTRGGIGGSLSVTLGAGGNATGATGAAKGGDGGSFSIAGSAGGQAQTHAGISGKGSSFSFVGGNGGDNAVSGGTAGDAGSVSLDTGLPGVASGGAAAGAVGAIAIGTTNARTITIGNPSSATTLPGLRLAVRAVTANFTFSLADQIVTIDATGGSVTGTLPAASAAFGNGSGAGFRVKRLDLSINTVTIACAGSDTMDTGTGTTLDAIGEAKSIYALSATSYGIF